MTKLHRGVKMLKIKPLLIYVIATFMILILFSSFDAEFYFEYSSKLNVTDEIMYIAFTFSMDELYINDPPGNDTEKATSYELNDSSDYIEDYKYILYYLDYLDYPEDNVFNVDLQSAVLQYQQLNDLEVNGILDTPTMDSLDDESIVYQMGKKGPQILIYQQILKELGYIAEDTEINGTFGEATRDAVEWYQNNNDLTNTGTIDADTQTALSRNLYDQVPAK